MSITTILKEKSANRNKLFLDYKLKNKKLPIGIVLLKDDLIDQVLIDALNILPANFIISWKNKNFDNNHNIAFLDDNFQNSGFDFVVCDDCEDDIMKYMRKWAVPIIYSAHTLSNLLSEFNAAKVEGNAYIFENNNLCDIYYAIIRYLENYKFSYDNKALVKNVLDV